MSPRVEPRKSGRVEVRERPIYSLEGKYSYFRDLALVQLADQRRDAAKLHPGLRGRDPGDPFQAGFALNPAFDNGDGIDGLGGSTPDERARIRLRTHERHDVEQRDVTTADPGAAAFLPRSAPSYVAEHFASAARAQATLSAAMRVEPLPATGMTVDVPAIVTGPTADIQNPQNSAVSETDADATSPTPTSPVATAAGINDVSRQALERSSPTFDVVLARELGRALGARVDLQIVAGTGANGQTRGLANVSGIATVTFTDASPTAPKTIGKTWQAYRTLSDPSTGYGVAEPSAYLTIMHTRRYAYLQAAGVAATTEQSGPLRIPGTVVPSASLRATLGAGTNEDEIFQFVRDEIPLYLGPIAFRAHEAGAESGTLTVRFSAIQYLALQADRQPLAVCRVSGTGLVNPAAL